METIIQAVEIEDLLAWNLTFHSILRDSRDTILPYFNHRGLYDNLS